MSACRHHRPLLLLLWEGFFALFQEEILINFIEWSTVQLPSLSAWQLCPFFKKQAESRAKAWLQLAQRLQQAAMPLGWVKELETCARHKLELTVLLFIQHTAAVAECLDHCHTIMLERSEHHFSLAEQQLFIRNTSERSQNDVCFVFECWRFGHLLKVTADMLLLLPAGCCPSPGSVTFSPNNP